MACINYLFIKKRESTINVILIARVSPKEQRDAGNSLLAQVARLEK